MQKLIFNNLLRSGYIVKLMHFYSHNHVALGGNQLETPNLSY